MPGTRSSTRNSSQATSSPKSQNEGTLDKTNGTKRKAPSNPSPTAKRTKPAKEQKTLEQTMPSKHQDDQADEADRKPDENETADNVEKSSKEDHSTAHTDGAVEETKERREAMPSNVLEKGIIYFFIRGRVDRDNLESVQDVARSYIVLRPLPNGAKLGDGPIQDLKNNRLLTLPKKVLPKSHQDRFTTFVEKVGVTIHQLKEDFMKGSEYTTQTTGVRHTPPVTPIGEGVYAITTTGRESHLAYILTIPSELGDVQEEMGLNERGSFVLSLKNPESSGPANTTFPQGADFTKDIMDEFRGRGWMPPEPKHLDFANAQLLLIGEAFGKIEKAVEPTSKDEKDDKKDTPLENMETLHEEDEQRTENLTGDESVFEDLGLSRVEFPKVQTTW